MMNSKPQISILMPIHHAAQTLVEALASCRAQTLEDWELLAITDRCDEATIRILTESAAADPRIRIIPSEGPGGLVPALNTAIAHAQGRLWARMDADDRMHPERLVRQAAFLDAQPEISVVGCAVRIFRDPGPSGTKDMPRDGLRRYETWLNALTTPEAIARERFVESPMVHPSIMLRPEALKGAGGYRDMPWAEDYDLWLRLLEAGHRFVKLPDVLLEWRDGPARLTRTDPRYGLDQFMAARAHFLARLTTVHDRGVMIAGAGPTGKALARLLKAESITVHGFVDVHTERIGKAIAGVPVVGIASIPLATADSPIQLAAVGQPGRRKQVLELFIEKGYTPGLDCWAVA